MSGYRIILLINTDIFYCYDGQLANSVANDRLPS